MVQLKTFRWLLWLSLTLLMWACHPEPTNPGNGGVVDTKVPPSESDADICVPSCDNKNCGDDGCGSVCGTCGDDAICTDGQCETTEDPCAGIPSVGACDQDVLVQCIDGASEETDCGALNQTCGWEKNENGTAGFACIDICYPACEGLLCGDDGCGGSCGECAENENCLDGLCQCTPSCEGIQCGDDGCGGSCGECAYWKEACLSGACVCQPCCDLKECGPDGCGGSCGDCHDGTACNSYGICKTISTGGGGPGNGAPRRA